MQPQKSLCTNTFKITLTLPCMNLKRCDYTAICQQLSLNHISNFMHFSKIPILFQKSDSTIYEVQLYPVINAKATKNEVKQSQKS